MTKDKFFEELLNGATWSAGVAFKRSNPLPLDRYSVFGSYSEAQNYAVNNAVAYPGQVLAVVDGSPLTVTVYVIDVNTEGTHSLKEVGTKPVGDGKSIEVKDGKITIYGFEEAAAQTYPRKKADGTIEWVTVQELVEGATENTVTVGDEKSISSTETDTGYELSIAGYKEATQGYAPVKGSDGIVWTELVTKDSYDDLVAIANGKTNTYVVNDLSKSDSRFATLGKEDVRIENSGYIMVDGAQTNPKIGDIYLIKELAYVDRWVSAIDTSTSPATIVLSALETEKVDLNGYVTEDQLDDYATQTQLEDKLNKTFAEEVTYNREGDSEADVEKLIKAIASEVMSHDYSLESKADKSELDNYVLKSVYDTYVSEHNETVEDFESRIGTLESTVEGIEIPDISNKEDKGKLHGAIASTGNRNGTYYIPFVDKVISQSSESQLVELVSGDGSLPLTVSLNGSGINLSAGSSGVVNINGNAATASVANALSTSATVNVNQLVQTDGEKLILNGGGAE